VKKDLGDNDWDSVGVIDRDKHGPFRALAAVSKEGAERSLIYLFADPGDFSDEPGDFLFLLLRADLQTPSLR